MFDAYLPILYLVALSLLIYRFARSDKARELLPLSILIVMGAILSLYQGINILLFFSLVIVFDLISFTYPSKEGFFMELLGVLYLYVAANNFSISIVAQAMLLGLVAEFGRLKFKAGKIAAKRTETSRDIVQIALGIVVLALLYYLKTSYAEFSILALIMLGYLTVNYGAANATTKLSKLLSRLERNYTKLGQGAAWLAIGTIATIAFVSDARYIAIVFFAIFIGDSLATIVGMRFAKYKLPYNKHKSLSGSLVYFLSVSVLPYLLYGIFAIPLAIIATVVESLPIKFDDNFSVPAVLILVYLIVETIL